MAAFREHVSVSAMLGFGYGFAASLGFGYSFVQGVLAGCLTGVAGMLPDLDSSSGRPIRELFGLVGAVAPLLLVNRVVSWLDLPGDPETVMLVIVLLYLLIKFGGAAVVGNLSVHRGMFHSIPALVIAAEVVYLSYPNPELRVRLLMAGGVAIGFFSHLLLDEIYSVDVSNMQVKLKKSSGTAIKLVGEDFVPNVFTYTLMATLTYATLADAGWLEQQSTPGGPGKVVNGQPAELPTNSVPTGKVVPPTNSALSTNSVPEIELGTAANLPMPKMVPLPQIENAPSATQIRRRSAEQPAWPAAR